MRSWVILTLVVFVPLYGISIVAVGGLSSSALVAGLAVSLSVLGLVVATVTARGTRLRVALARLQLAPWYAVAFAVTFGGATLAWLDQRMSVENYNGIVVDDALLLAGFVSGAGLIAMAVGYLVAPPALVRGASAFDNALRGRGTFSNRPSSVWILWSVSLLAFAAKIATGGLGYLSDPVAQRSADSSVFALISALSLVGVLATLLAAYQYQGRRTGASLAVLVLVLGTQFALGAFSGNKEAAIIHLVAFVVGISAAHGRLRVLPIAAVSLIAVFLVTPFITAYRDDINTSGGRLSPLEAVQTLDFGSLIAGTADEGVDSTSTAQFFARLSRLGDVAIIVQQTPSAIGYLGAGELLTGPLLGFVPRSLWPDKPVLDAGYQVNVLYRHSPAFVSSSAAVTPYGDLWRHGGWWVVVVGMGVLGIFIRLVDGRRDRSGADAAESDDPRLLFLPMLLFTSLVKQELDYLALTASLTSVVIVATFAVRLVSRPAQASARGTGAERWRRITPRSRTWTTT